MANAKTLEEAQAIVERLKTRYPGTTFEYERQVFPANQWREEIVDYFIYEVRTCDVCGARIEAINFGETEPEGELCESCRSKRHEAHEHWMIEQEREAEKEARERQSFDEWCG